LKQKKLIGLKVKSGAAGCTLEKTASKNKFNPDKVILIGN
jgi:hypothetical protein